MNLTNFYAVFFKKMISQGLRNMKDSYFYCKNTILLSRIPIICVYLRQKNCYANGKDRICTRTLYQYAQKDKHFGKYIAAFAKGTLLGARGNSGVILSQRAGMTLSLNLILGGFYFGIRICNDLYPEFR